MTVLYNRKSIIKNQCNQYTINEKGKTRRTYVKIGIHFKIMLKIKCFEKFFSSKC